MTWGYKNALANVIWSWAIQKKLMADSSRYSRSDREQSLKLQDQKPIREVINDLATDNSTLPELITEAKEEASRLEEENRTSKESIDLRKSEGLNRSTRRLDTEKRPFKETTSEEEGLNKGGRLKRQRTQRSMDSDEEKRIGGKIRFEREREREPDGPTKHIICPGDEISRHAPWEEAIAYRAKNIP